MNNNTSTALISGITGYIGSQLAKALLKRGWKVHGIVRNNSSTHLLHDCQNQLSLGIYDGTLKSLTDICFSQKFDVVFHLASLFIAEHKSEEITDLITSNILFGNHLLEAMQINQIKQLINTGTSWQHYQNKTYKPTNLYAATKEAFEKIIEFYVEAYQFKTITLELFDTYGPNDPRKKIINLFKRIAANGEKLSMSPGKQLLDLVYIDDVIEAYITAYDLLNDSDTHYHRKYSIKTSHPLSLRKIAGEYEQVYQQKLNIEWGGKPYRKREVMKTWTKGKKLPGWNPTYSLRNGLEKLKEMEET